jgi:hypothetical protein
MAGNRLGERARYLYSSDSGSTYILETDSSLAIAGFGAAGAAPVAYNPATPGDATPAPRRFKPRGVYVQSAADGARKFVICFSATASAYARNNSASYTIDTEEGWQSTGRVGEKQTF